jgi:lipopolysaccharide export system permease protein
VLKLLDRYMLRRFLVTYLFVATTVLGLFVVVDMTSRVKKFRKAGCNKRVPNGAERCPSCNAKVPARARRCVQPSSTALLITHYSSHVPLIYIQLAPFIAVLAGMIVIADLQRRNELIPMRTAGLAPLRTVAPILAASLALGGFTWLVQEKLLPELQGLIERAGLVGKNIEQFPEALPDKNKGVLFVGAYYTDERAMHDLRYQRLDELGREREEIVARIAVWDPEAQRWSLSDGAHFQYDESGDWRRDPATGEPSITRFGARGPPLPTNILPRDLVQASQSLNALSSEDLRAQRARIPRDNAKLDVLLQSRLSYPLAGFVLVLLGLSFVLSPTANLWLGLVACLLICSSYFLATFMLLELAKFELMPASVAAWLPNGVYFAFGLARLQRSTR